jgi:putative membrane protein
LVLELVLVTPTLTRAEIRKLVLIDAVFGASAVLVLIAGLLQWFHGGKPSAFYTHNPVFIAKITLFAIAALLSIHPTVYFIRNRKGPDGESVMPPKSVSMAIRIELAAILFIPLLAVLMARGVGLK